MTNSASFMATLEHPCMITRLGNELREAAREFREGPRAFITSALKSGRGSGRRTSLLRFGLAIGLLVYALAFSVMLALWYSGHRQQTMNREISVTGGLEALYTPYIKLATDDQQSRGGGGGGRDENAPASKGELPAPFLNPIVGPRPEESIRPPVLPMIEAVKLDPRIQIERDDLIPTGLPDGASAFASAGPGKNGGIGTGSDGGIGPGKGAGVGPGHDGGLGDGGFHIGGPRRTDSQTSTAVDSRPVLLNEPRPFYTEEARKNKVQGVVKVRILVDESGAVRQVIVTRALPDGLSEQAIRAANQMRFRPAMKNGQAVAYWISNVEIEFNLR
ncbi:MAG TPA: energy transducer TonB [Blastocatellia bacterium]|nr:energy transducer TonB [Blastocatellia bacterium]